MQTSLIYNIIHENISAKSIMDEPIPTSRLNKEIVYNTEYKETIIASVPEVIKKWVTRKWDKTENEVAVSQAISEITSKEGRPIFTREGKRLNEVGIIEEIIKPCK